MSESDFHAHLRVRKKVTPKKMVFSGVDAITLSGPVRGGSVARAARTMPLRMTTR